MPNFSLKDQMVFEAARQFATPFHLYSERGIRQTARALKDAFGEIEDFREYFAATRTCWCWTSPPWGWTPGRSPKSAR